MYIIHTDKVGLFLQSNFRIKLLNPPQFFHIELGFIGLWIAKSK